VIRKRIGLKNTTTVYDGSTSRHSLNCQILTFSHYFTFRFLNLKATKPSISVVSVCEVELTFLFWYCQ